MKAPSDADFLADLETGICVPDTQFDKIFPSSIRDQARIHWTPVSAAIDAVKLFSDPTIGAPSTHVLDVGSNVGKFCIVCALASSMRVTGVERRRKCVDTARAVTRAQRVERVRYLWRDMEDVEWSEYNGIYLYNPFHENIDAEIRIDNEVAFSSELFDRYVLAVQRKLASCARHTRVVTFYGFGGSLPSDFERVDVGHLGVHEKLELWIKKTS